MGFKRYICAALLVHIRTYAVFLSKFLNLKMNIPQKLADSVKIPKFLDTVDKWNAVVLSIDSAKKFDDLALKLIDDDEVDVFQFHDILLKLAEDVKLLRPDDGEVITFIAETVSDMLKFLIEKSTKRYEDIVKNTCGNLE